MSYLDDAVNASEATLQDSYRRHPVIPNASPLSQSASGPITGAVDPTLNDRVASSEATLQQSYARNPVVPNAPTSGAPSTYYGDGLAVGASSPSAPAPVAAPAAPAGVLSAYGDPGSGLMIPTNEPPSEGGGGFRVGALLDHINAFFRPDSTSARSFTGNAVPDATVAQPRGPQTAAAGALPVSEGVPQSVAVPQPYATYGGAPGPLSQAVGGQVVPPDYKAQYAAMQAKDQQDFQDRRNAMLAQGQAASASQDLVRARGDQRVANFNAENARLDVAGNIGGEGRYASAELADAAAKRAGGETAAVEQRLDAANKGQQGTRNYLDEFAKTQQTLQQSKETGTKQALAQAELAGKQLSLADQKQLSTLRAQLAAETDPGKVKALQDKVLALEGKVPPQDRVAVVQVDTGQKDMMGQPIYKNAAVNINTGQMVGGDTAAAKGSGAGKYPAVQPAAVDALRAKKVTPEQFDAFYGPGAAAANLK